MRWKAGRERRGVRDVGGALFPLRCRRARPVDPKRRAAGSAGEKGEQGGAPKGRPRRSVAPGRGVRGAVERAGECVRVGDLGRVRERAGAREGEGRPR